MMQAAEKRLIPGFFNEAVYPTGKLRQLVCHGFPTYGSSRGQQTTVTSLGCLRQMETKSVLVHLYTEQACCGSFSRHLGSSSAFKYRLRLLH